MAMTETISQPTTPKWKTTSGSTSGAKKPVNIPPSNNPYARPGSDKCFRCNQPGHRSNQCPKRQMVNLVETKVGREEEEVSKYEEIKASADEGILLSQSLMI
jgi:hypothetical protein